MLHPATSQFLEGLQSSQLLDDARIEELRSRPEAYWGNVESLANYVQERGWLTAYQTREIQEGRGNKLVIHGYRIFDKIDDGPGGMTFKAIHPALQQPVTFRILRPDWLAPADTPSDYVARAQAASLAHSPHIATVLDAGTLDSGPFVVQEYVDGCDLFRLVNEMGALPFGLACEYVRQAAVALKAAHNCGVAHGEVSPHTLLLSPVSRVTEPNGDVTIRPRPGATIKLAELGLTPRRPPVGELTYGQSDRVGPLAFFAPERMTSGERTVAGDAYGLGATLYYLLTTRPPHAGESQLAVMLNLQQAEPAPLETLTYNLPPEVIDLVRRLLSRDPSGRPSAAEVADALLPFGDPSARPEATPNASSVLLAHETATQVSVPVAVPVARNLDEPTVQMDSSPMAEDITEQMPPEQPVVHAYNGQDLMPEIHPLDEHLEANGEHLDAFGHSALGTDAPRIARPRVQASPKQKYLIALGLVLHLTGTALCLGWAGCIPNPFSTKHPTNETKPVEKDPSKSKTKAHKG